MRVARAVSSRSRVRFSTVSSPGKLMRLALIPLAIAEAGKESDSSGWYCFAKLDRMLATAAEVSSCGMSEDIDEEGRRWLGGHGSLERCPEGGKGNGLFVVFAA